MKKYMQIATGPVLLIAAAAWAGICFHKGGLELTAMIGAALILVGYVMADTVSLEREISPPVAWAILVGMGGLGGLIGGAMGIGLIMVDNPAFNPWVALPMILAAAGGLMIGAQLFGAQLAKQQRRQMGRAA
jgi:hypothetical protein